MNSPFVQQQATALAARPEKNGKARGEAEKIGQADRLLFNRPPKQEGAQLGLEFLRNSNQVWNQYLQVLLSSNEFVSVR